ncbi:hypothetical protein OTU49_004679, partial [Cherax quadricarinatus]
GCLKVLLACDYIFLIAVMSAISTVDLLIKLGGSAITEKTQLETFNETAISIAVKMVKMCADKGLKLILVHGAGSFGHQQAKKYNVNGGWVKNNSGSQVKLGFSLTRVSCLKLNAKVVEQLTNEGLPAVGISPCGKWTTKNDEVIQSGVAAVYDLLKAGFIPVLHGDCVLDTIKGSTILSGDTVIKTLCKDLPVKKVVFLTDVAGIFDKPPHRPDAKLLSNIIVDKNGKIAQKIATDALSCDVTGGIELKLSSAINIVVQNKGTIPVFVCKVGSEAAEKICLEKQPSLHDGGTVITLSQDN